MVTTLAHSQHGRQYLAQQGIMEKISNMIRGADTDPFSSLYLPGGIRLKKNTFCYITLDSALLDEYDVMFL